MDIEQHSLKDVLKKSSSDDISNINHTDSFSNNDVNIQILNANNGSNNIDNSQATSRASKFYRFCFRFWSLFFWLSMLLGATHGMISKSLIFYRSSGKTFEDYLLYFFTVLFFARYEAYQGFQNGFSPVLVLRTYELSTISNKTHSCHCLIHFLLAPFTSAGFLFATRERLITSWSVLIFVLVLVYLLELPIMNQKDAKPGENGFHLLMWHASIDTGVAVGLLWGVVTICYWTVRLARGGEVWAGYKKQYPRELNNILE